MVECWFRDTYVCSIDRSTGYINVSLYCLVRGKSLLRYNQRKNSKNLHAQCFRFFKPYPVTYIKAVQRNNQITRSHFFHPILFLHMALWCSDSDFAHAIVTIMDYFNKHARSLLNIVLKQSELKIDEFKRVDDTDSCFHGYCHVHYTDFEVVTDPYLWYNATALCKKYKHQRKTVLNFEKNDQTAQILGNLLNRTVLAYDIFKDFSTNPWNGRFYHPFLFVRFSAWLDVSVFLNVSRIVMIVIQNPIASVSEHSSTLVE